MGAFRTYMSREISHEYGNLKMNPATGFDPPELDRL